MRLAIRSSPSPCRAALLRRWLASIALWPLAGLAQAASDPAVVPDTLAERVSACMACHGEPTAAQRNRPYYPRIAGKAAGYLVNQLDNFRAGRRQVPVMTWMVQHMSDAYLREIAAYFAAQPAPAPSPAVAAGGATAAAQDELARGRQLVLHGDPALNVPACMACHGARLTGMTPAIPGLLGLPRDYINAQFGAWRNGSRHAHAPDCMGTVATRLSLADVSAVSGWLASAPVPPDPAPAAAGAQALPLACGSQPANRP